MARLKASLPIQCDIGVVTPGSGKTNIEKCLRSEIGTGNVDRVGRPGNNTRPVESQISNDLSGQQRRYGYRRRDWEEIAGVIRFNFMRPHTRNRPTSGSSTG